MHGRWLGVDFSGNAAMWRPRCARPTVWVAELVAKDGDVRLDLLRPVQALPGSAPPFERLVQRLRTLDYDVAAIDAPLGVPDIAMPPGGYPALLRIVADLASDPKRPFPKGGAVVAQLLGEAAGYGLKRYRPATLAWRERGLNLRSPVWAGPRGGAPLLAASLRLVIDAERPVWPMQAPSDDVLQTLPAGAIVEGYPAGQLRVWGLPHTRYGQDDAEARERRAVLAREVAKRVVVGAEMLSIMGTVPDALDAVLCAIGARAASTGRLALPETLERAGFIYVEAPAQT